MEFNSGFKGLIACERLYDPRSRYSAPVQIGSGAHPASCTMGAESLPAVKWPGRGVDQPPQSIAEVKERVTLYILPPSPGPSWPVLG